MTERRAIGSAGPRVHPVGLGAMPLSLEGRPPEADAVRVICAALDAGIDLVDTADAYGLDERDAGHNERLVARALDEWRGGAEVVVATKGGVRRPSGGWSHDGRPEHLRAACEASLRALRRERISLYQLHAPDVAVPLEDSLGALAELRAEGKIEHVGLSNVDVGQVRRALDVVPVASVQNQASVYHPRGLDDGVLALCEAEGIAFIAHSSLGGWRAGRIAHEPLLQRLARRHGASQHQIALAWLLAASPVLVPIPGASRVANAVASAAVPALVLDPEDLEELDRAFRPGA